MNITKIGVNQSESYIPREVAVDSTRTKSTINQNTENSNLNNWQEDILINALDKLANNIQVDNSHPLGRAENRPLASYQEALDILSEINAESLRNVGSSAQANVSASSFIQLMMEG
jgi:hypothetical protein